jgi:hypothetical protein
MATSTVFSGTLLGAGLTVVVGIAIPLALYYSEPGETRTKLRGWFVWPAAIISAGIVAYLLAGVDYLTSKHANVWDVFLTSFVLLEVLAIIVVIQADRALARQKTALAEPSAELVNQIAEIIPAQPNPQQPSVPVVRVCMSSSQYGDAILSIEREARRIDRMTKRISAIFKDPSEVEAIAARRFGPGSRQAEAYRWEHSERHRVFMENLTGKGGVCREVYQVEELRRYFNERHHGVDVTLPRSIIRRTAREWLSVLAAHDNYYVGLTLDPIPIKYQIFDQKNVVIHEAAGKMDGQRLNALILSQADVVASFQSDFDSVWDRIPVEMRTTKTVVAFIETELMPFLDED